MFTLSAPGSRGPILPPVLLSSENMDDDLLSCADISDEKTPPAEPSDIMDELMAELGLPPEVTEAEGLSMKACVPVGVAGSSDGSPAANRFLTRSSRSRASWALNLSVTTARTSVLLGWVPCRGGATAGWGPDGGAGIIKTGTGGSILQLLLSTSWWWSGAPGGLFNSCTLLGSSPIWGPACKILATWGKFRPFGASGLFKPSVFVGFKYGTEVCAIIGDWSPFCSEACTCTPLGTTLSLATDSCGTTTPLISPWPLSPCTVATLWAIIGGVTSSNAILNCPGAISKSLWDTTLKSLCATSLLTLTTKLLLDWATTSTRLLVLDWFTRLLVLDWVFSLLDWGFDWGLEVPPCGGATVVESVRWAHLECCSSGCSGVGPGVLEGDDEPVGLVVVVVGVLVVLNTRSSSGSLDGPERKTKQKTCYNNDNINSVVLENKSKYRQTEQGWSMHV